MSTATFNLLVLIVGVCGASAGASIGYLIILARSAVRGMGAPGGYTQGEDRPAREPRGTEMTHDLACELWHDRIDGWRWAELRQVRGHDGAEERGEWA